MRRKYPKILILAGWYPNLLHKGEGDFIQHQAELMFKHGLNVSVFHSNLTFKYLFKGIWKKVTDSKIGLPVHLVERAFLPRNTKVSMKMWARIVLRDAIKYVDENGLPDIIHAHTYLGGYIAALIQRKLDIPYIVTLHESAFLTESIPKHHDIFITKALKEAKKVVCVGTKLSEKVKTLKGINSSVIANFIDFDIFTPKGKKHKAFTFIYVGELISRKNVKALLPAFKLAKESSQNIQLTIVGDGPDAKALFLSASKMGIIEDVKFKGRLSQKEVACELAKSHCLVLPSTAETFGIVLVEAMACGLPTIASKSGGPRDIVSDSFGMLLESDEPNYLAAVMCEMKLNYSNYDPKKTRMFAKSKFGADTVLEEYNKLYIGSLE